MKQPYDPRTLRYCARVLRSESRQRLARIEGSKCPNYWQGQANELIFRAMDFEYEAGAIERSNKLPPKAERLAKTLCGPNRDKRARAIERKDRK